MGLVTTFCLSYPALELDCASYRVQGKHIKRYVVLRVHWRSSKILTLDDATIEQKCRVQYATTPSIVFFLKVSGALIFQNKKEADILGQPHYLA